MATPIVISDMSTNGVMSYRQQDFNKVLVAGANVTGDKVGGMISVGTSDGLGYVAADAASRRVVGVLLGGETDIDGVAATTGQKLFVAGGIFLMKNDTGTPITNASIGLKCYVKDNVTVSGATGSNSVIAGTVLGLQDGKVKVAIGMGYVA
jgi:hypothetical protein